MRVRQNLAHFKMKFRFILKYILHSTGYLDFNMHFQYTIPAFVDPDASDLISKILVLTAKKRPSLQEILDHPWVVKNAQEKLKIPSS